MMTLQVTHKEKEPLVLQSIPIVSVFHCVVVLPTLVGALSLAEHDPFFIVNRLYEAPWPCLH